MFASCTHRWMPWSLPGRNPDKQVVFFAIGFETTAPANVMSVLHARALGLTNYSVLVSHVRVPPAMDAILSDPSCRVQGFLLAGHVCTVMGYHEYPGSWIDIRIPMVVTGFEPLDLARGILETVQLLEAGKVEIKNAYSRAVTFEGNLEAQRLIDQVFEECDRAWRGIGVIPASGWRLRPDVQGLQCGGPLRRCRHLSAGIVPVHRGPDPPGA